MRNYKSFSMLKDIMHDLLDENNKERTIPIGTTAKRNLESNRIKALSLFCSILMNTDFISYETKYYLSHRDLSMEKVYRDLTELEYYEKHNLRIPKNSRVIINKISYDQSRVDAKFGENIVSDILNKSSSYMQYVIAMSKYREESVGNNLKDKLTLNLDNNAIYTTLTDEEFNRFLTTIAPYTTEKVTEVTKSISKNQAGYFNYLLISPNGYLSPEDSERKLKLVGILTNTLSIEDLAYPDDEIEDPEGIEDIADDSFIEFEDEVDGDAMDD